jgi:GTP-binding protein
VQPEAAGVLVTHARAHAAYQLLHRGAGQGADPVGFLVDLPGYGYAEVSGSAKFHWQGLLSDYVQARTQLSGLILMMDARRPFTDLDCQMVEWFLPTGKPIHVLLTKADKLTTSENAKALREAKVLADTRRRWKTRRR